MISPKNKDKYYILVATSMMVLATMWIRLLKEYDVDEVVLASPGGLGYEGYMTANALSRHEKKVRVAEGTYCLSACAIAFIGGTDYIINNGVLRIP